MVEPVRIPDTPEVFKYYICCHPYPSNDQKDCITLGRWIVSILGCTIPLHAIYYRHAPETSDKVIFAVNKVYPRLGRLLGEHRWDEFLKKPTGEGLKSQIFNCTYETDRSLQEDDWKPISVEDSFFVNWGIRKWVTKVPYPAPHPLPGEKPLYRPIPRVFLGPRTSPGSSDVKKNKVDNLDRTRATDKKIPRAPNSSAGAGESPRGSRNYYSSPSSGYTSGSTTAVSSAPSSPVPSLSVQDQELIGIGIKNYENDDDEEITEETCYGNWEITSVPMVLPEPLTVIYETGPVDLWANLKPIIHPTGSVTAAEAKAKKDKKALCPIHMGKCKKGICVVYKDMVRKQENVARKRGKKEEARGKKDTEKDSGSKKDGEKKNSGSKEDGEKKDLELKRVGEDPGSKGGGQKDAGKVADEKALNAGNEADNKQVKEDVGQSYKRNGEEKSRPWDEYTSDEDDIDDFFSLPVGSKPGAKKFYDDEEFFK